MKWPWDRAPRLPQTFRRSGPDPLFIYDTDEKMFCQVKVGQSYLTAWDPQTKSNVDVEVKAKG